MGRETVVLEITSLMVRRGEQAAFERAFTRAESLIRTAAGYLSHELCRSVENEQHYALLVEWRRIEDPTRGFVPSHAFDQLRERLQAFLITPPEVEHFQAAPARAALPLAD